jgi:hypothetical protein
VFGVVLFASTLTVALDSAKFREHLQTSVNLGPNCRKVSWHSNAT